MNQTPPSSISVDEIRHHLLAAIAQELKLSPDTVRADQPLMSFGIDSMQFIGMIGELEEWLGCRILSNPLARYPTVDDLAAWIARELAAGRTQLNPNHDV
ncbi:MAG: acyl carrier protein [Pirellulaceae bacterium]|jgi:phthiocerol/phenolphthiocerol synthesis type-I polyketide synthase C|nr:acyl carrier protein [Pirellulaceae bacterium]